MVKIEEVFIESSDVIAYLIREANATVAVEFGINQTNCPKHPSFCENSWVEADFQRGERYFLLTENDQPLACVAYEIPNNNGAIRKAYLNRLSVLPEQQNKGIGSQLVEYVITLAQFDYLDIISIGVISQHTRLQHWYERLGFVKSGIRHFDHLPFDVTYMTYNRS